MKQTEKIDICKEKPLVLFSPLDWGLGHTTRCIPLLSELIQNGCSVIVACNSMQKAILQPEFSQISFVHMEGYNLRYGKNKAWTYIMLILQLPKILIKIKNENWWISKFLQSNAINAVISDNRYGFYSRKIPSFFITHQLYIQTGLGKWINNITQRFNYTFIRNFSECWVPDFKGPINAAGILSHPIKYPSIPVQYLGCLSRFPPNSAKDMSLISETPVLPSLPLRLQPWNYDLLFILSGPEPQRSILEKRIYKQLAGYPGRSALVRGLPGGAKYLSSPTPKTTIFEYASSAELNQLINQSALVVSRSGYTTIMDLLKVKKKMILVPTPGQGEQEYLAAHLQSKNLAIVMKQQEFFIQAAIEQASSFDFQYLNEDMALYKEVIRKFVSNLTESKS